MLAPGSPPNQRALDYARVAAAIRYLRAEAPRQPTLAEVAAHVRLSPAHFQRTFTAWAGISPKKFARTLTLEYAKGLLAEGGASPTLFDAADRAGLSSASRLHDVFVRLEAMTPREFRDGGAGLVIRYARAATRFGEAFIASTPRGICSLSFCDDTAADLATLHRRYPAATLLESEPDELQQRALAVIDGAAAEPSRPLALHVRGTPFQVQVWRALLGVAPGSATTYGSLARGLGSPRAAQAVGGAVGANHVAWLIPCHRVIRGDGDVSGYAWGVERKVAMLGVEALV